MVHELGWWDRQAVLSEESECPIGSGAQVNLPLLRISLLVAGTLILVVTPVRGQELEPRLYSNTPVGVNALALSYGYSGGNVLLVPSLPLEDVDGSLNLVALTYLRAVDLFGKAGKFEATLPYAWGNYEGFVEGEFRTRELVGFGDPRFRLAVNLTGAPALNLEEFANYRQKTIVGVGLQVSVPVGKYEPDRLFNLGANRWSFRPEIGISRVWRKWFFEVAGGGLFFTTNSDFFGGQALEQRPFFAIKTHAIRTFRPGLWLAINFGYGTGGEWKVNGEPRGNVQRNYRFGGTLSLPLIGGSSIKVIGASGVAVRFGSDFDVVVLAYQYTWGGQRK